MGLNIGLSRSSYKPSISTCFGGRISESSFSSSSEPEARPKLDPNPDPRHYHVNKIYQFEKGYVMDIIYPNCTNYEGRKILVYLGNVEDHYVEFMRYGIDPHFCEVPYAPFARFEPTEMGLELAIMLVKNLL